MLNLIKINKAYENIILKEISNLDTKKMSKVNELLQYLNRLYNNEELLCSVLTNNRFNVTDNSSFSTIKSSLLTGYMFSSLNLFFTFRFRQCRLTI